MLATNHGGGKSSLLAMLLAHNADVHQANHHGHRAIHFAVGADRPDALALLIESGADLNVQNNNGDTQLNLAVSGSDRCFTVLLEAGADPNISNNRGSSPLHETCRDGKLDHITALLRHGAHVNQPNAIGMTPAHLACIFEQIDAMLVLIRHGADLSKIVGSDRLEPLIERIRRKGWEPCVREWEKQALRSQVDIHLPDGESIGL